MTMTTQRREMDCPVDGRIALDEACCPVCTRPLEACDGATQARHGYDNPTVMPRSLCGCEHCPPDDRGHTAAYDVSWSDAIHDSEVHRTERARLIGVFTAEGELIRDLGEVERELFRVCFPELGS